VKKRILLFSALLLLFNSSLKAQNLAPPLPQRSITARVTKDLCFGDLSLESSSAGGTVSVDCNGIRSFTGDVYLMNSGESCSPAILEFILCPGRSVKVIYTTASQLSDGAFSMNMAIGNISIGSTVITASGQSFFSNKGCNDIHYIQIGGTLTVGNLLANPPGEYTGTFSVTLAQE